MLMPKIRSLSSALVLTLASKSPLLHHYVPDLEELLKKIIDSARLWRDLGSSAELIELMLKTILQKQRLGASAAKSRFTRV